MLLSELGWPEVVRDCVGMVAGAVAILGFLYFCYKAGEF